jgi:hypothetical protein
LFWQKSLPQTGLELLLAQTTEMWYDVVVDNQRRYKMSDIVTTTSPNSEGEMLWCVHFKSSYYDDDPRGAGIVPVDGRFYVLAKGREEAVLKVAAGIEETRKRCDEDADEEIEATIITLENLIPARDSSNEGRLGWVSDDKLRAVELSCLEDSSRYRLSVCLVPVD